MKNETAAPIAPELILRAKQGDRAAMEELYRATSQDVYRTIHAMIKNEDLTLDVQQDTYVTAFSHLNQLRDPASFRPWIRRIALNEAKGALRKKKSLLFSELSDVEGEDFPETADFSPENQPEPALERQETARLVRELLDDLSDGQRLLVGMYYYEQMPIRQIAENLNISEGTVKNQLFRSKKKIEAGVKRLEAQGVKLFGLAPLPFLTALLRKLEPAAKPNDVVLQHVLTETGAAGTAAIHVGRRFFETVAGKIILGLMAAGVIAGGVMGYRYWRDLNDRNNEIHLEVPETDPMDTDSPDDLIIPEQPPTGPSETEPEATDTTEDLVPAPSTSEPSTETDSTEPEPTEPEPTGPEPTEPEPTNPPPAEPPVTNPPPTEPVPAQPEPTEPPPTEPPSTEPHPTEPQPTEPEPTEPPPSESAPMELPRVVYCSWHDDFRENPVYHIYDREWGSSDYIYVKTINEGDSPKLYTDNPAVVSVGEEEFFFGYSLGEGETGYRWEVTFLGPGTAHLYCSLDGEVTHELTVENPEYPEMVIGTECFHHFITYDDVLNDCHPDELFRFRVFVQGMSMPELYTDDPGILYVDNNRNRQRLSAGISGPLVGDSGLNGTDWIHRLYCWDTYATGTGTVHITLKLNGVVEKIWTINVTAAETPSTDASAESPAEPQQ